jgi:REP element-mobilizing transposase RayT
MGRPPRNDHEGAWSHVMNRGSDRQDIFSDHIDHRRYLTLVGDAVERGLIEVHAHCEMTNHFHQLVRSPTGELSVAMHRIQSEFARWYNERHGRTGPLFTSRFTSVPITTDDQLLTVARYIHRNPLVIVEAHRLAEYPWSSYPVHLGRAAAPEWLTTGLLLDVAGMTRDEFQRFVETDLPSDHTPTRSVQRRVTLEELLAAVSGALGVPATQLVMPRSGAPLARQVLSMLAVELRVASTRELAEALGLAGAGSVRVLARRGRVRVDGDANVAAVRANVLRALGQPGCAVPGTGVTGPGTV